MLTRQNQQFGERKLYKEPHDRDDLRLKRSCRNEMASTDRDMIGSVTGAISFQVLQQQRYDGC